MLEKVALLIELSEVAQELDQLGKLADSDSIMNMMERLASEISVSTKKQKTSSSKS